MSSSHRLRRWSVLAGLCCALLGTALQGCSDKNSGNSSSSSSPGNASSSSNNNGSGNGNAANSTPNAQTPVAVRTFKAEVRDLPLTIKTNGTVTALSSVDVRSQVSSSIVKVHFAEGQFVHAGQLLFTLDARNEVANLAKARAQLSKDQASLNDAKRQLERAKQLLAQNFISQGAVDTAQAQVDGATASLAADTAAIEAAKVAVSYNRITAPSAGRAGAVNVFAGSAVVANQTPLVTITQLDPIAVAYSIPQRNLTDVLEALQRGDQSVEALLATDKTPLKGRLSFVDNAVDAGAGTVKAKAVFNNRDSKLWPGAFVDVSQTIGLVKGMVVLPQAAVIQSARGSVVYLVQSGKAVLRPITIVRAQGEDVAVTGVAAGDLVVLEGKQNLKPNAAVNDLSSKP